ncbi:methyl-accepting chemotaxis protein [Alkalicoccobacillus murimartini]|uniref:Methyl-accepting chemotaxis protein n=1 Tax=Alkalicoccobacillus murimartini TaxID=171685 RepID=A0ABT9YGJ0_9BACI|nr:methyl-accepting chemotaxis protein [Alkalicoccobacillus murimartini]MDQ0206977.1 methyl-accepting chemotaxis protein [Alkalicoccobacillus murimartini]
MKSIRGKLFSVFGTMVLLFFGLSIYLVASLIQTNERMESMQEVDFELLLLQERMANSMNDRLALFRGYIIFGEEDYLQRFEAVNEQMIKTKEELVILSSSDQLAGTIEKSDQWLNIIENDVLPLYQNGDVDAANESMRANTTGLAREITSSFQELADDRRANMEASFDKNTQELNSLKIIVISTVSFSVILMIVLILWLASAITKPLKRLVKEADLIANADLSSQPLIIKTKDELAILGNSFNEMKKSLRTLIGQTRNVSENVAATSQQLSASSEETSAATNQIADTIQSLTNTAEQNLTLSNQSLEASSEMEQSALHISKATHSVKVASEDMDTRSTEGRETVSKAIQQIESINQTVGATSKTMNQLEQQASEIGSILELITSISDQTNLLSLNAAIEAARAGESGKGFAVVAGEVRNLAEQSKESVTKIEAMIKSIQHHAKTAASDMQKGTSEVTKGTQMIKEVDRSFEEISTSINKVNEQIQTVTASADDISNRTIQLKDHISQMNHAAKSTLEGTEDAAASTEEQLAAMEEVASSAQGLADLAGDLRDEISRFKVEESVTEE